jgi:glycosyltransferase involved in cell wall biosynthesis
MKVDVVIPTLAASRVRPRLIKVLESASWVNNIIYETSKPLARARIVGASKCTTKWVAMFDDDVEIPLDWFDKVSGAIAPGVVAVSTPDLNADPDFLAVQLIADRLLKLERRDTPFIDNTLFLKSTLEGYDPPHAFYCEDELFYEHVKSKGRWVHTPPVGVRHFYAEKDALFSGASQRVYKFELGTVMIRRALVRFVLPIFAAIFYTRSLRTVYRLWRINIRNAAGWLMGPSLKQKIGTAWRI